MVGKNKREIHKDLESGGLGYNRATDPTFNPSRKKSGFGVSGATIYHQKRRNSKKP